MYRGGRSAKIADRIICLNRAARTARDLSRRPSPAREEEPRKGVAQDAGLSLHAGIGVEADQREKLERLTRYVSRPPMAEERLDVTAQGQVRYGLKTAYRDGTTHIVPDPLDFIARLAALVPPPLLL